MNKNGANGGNGGRAVLSRILRDLVVLTDEQLEYEAERFRFFQVFDLLGVPFWLFLKDPEYYIGKACKIVRMEYGLDRYDVSVLSEVHDALALAVIAGEPYA